MTDREVRLFASCRESLTQSTDKPSLCDQEPVRTHDAFVEQYILK